MRTAFDVVKIIAIRHALALLEFNIYLPSLAHFKDRKEENERRDPKDALKHNARLETVALSREEIVGGGIVYLARGLSKGEALQTLSRVRRGPGENYRYIPMLDFEIKPSKANEKFAIQCVRSLGEVNGALLVSGASYHYYGYELMDIVAWRNFMYRSILLDGIVDSRWVAHRLLDEVAMLRLTPKGPNGFVPYVVREL